MKCPLKEKESKRVPLLSGGVPHQVGQVVWLGCLQSSLLLDRSGFQSVSFWSLGESNASWYRCASFCCGAQGSEGLWVLTDYQPIGGMVPWFWTQVLLVMSTSKWPLVLPLILRHIQPQWVSWQLWPVSWPNSWLLCFPFWSRIQRWISLCQDTQHNWHHYMLQDQMKYRKDIKVPAKLYHGHSEWFNELQLYEGVEEKS